MLIDSVTLHCTTGTSYKSYSISLIEQAGGYIVASLHGRIGGTQHPGTSWRSPMSLADARKAFAGLEKEKLRKGYVVVKRGTAENAAAEDARPEAVAPDEHAGLPVMLLNAIKPEQLDALLADPIWCMEPKADGERRLVVIDGNESYGVNRRGYKVPLSPLLQKAIAASSLLGRTVLDGEDMGESFVVFDVLAFDGLDLADSPLSERIIFRDCIAPRLPGVTVTTTATTVEAKRALYEAAKASKQEGVVFKRLDATYSDGRPNSGGPALKCTFVESASCVVLGTNNGKRSIRLGLRDEAGNMVEVGSVTVPANQSIPADGAVCEVEYLYAYRNGSLYQPVLKQATRPDVDASECVLSQLKYVEDRTEISLAA